MKNKKLSLLSKFAKKAKPFVGNIKLSEMHKNDKYAFESLSKAILSGDEELQALAKEVSNDFEIDIALIAAI